MNLELDRHLETLDELSSLRAQLAAVTAERDAAVAETDAALSRIEGAASDLDAVGGEPAPGDGGEEPAPEEPQP